MSHSVGGKYVQHVGPVAVPRRLEPVVVRFRDGDVLHGYRAAWEEPCGGRFSLYLAYPGEASPRLATVNLNAVEAVFVAGVRRETISLSSAV